MSNSTMSAYLAPKGLLHVLKEELEWKKIQILKEYGDLVVTEANDSKVYFAQNTWRNVGEFSFESIRQASDFLKEKHPRWVNYSFDFHRRAALIQDQLRVVGHKPINFLADLSSYKPLASWVLVDKEKLLYSTETTSLFPNGEVNFVENKIDPPSRAYLKLWEFFTTMNRYPSPGQTCLDMGACPGGWTWVVAGLGAKVISYDKAPLDERLMTRENIEYRGESAFGVRPEKLGHIDWFFSDIICYPAKSYQLVTRWLEKGQVDHFAVTIKFQGKTDFETLAQFEAIEGSSIVHLYCNKHELTWFYFKEKELK